jgi:hypothetical protein
LPHSPILRRAPPDTACGALGRVRERAGMRLSTA